MPSAYAKLIRAAERAGALLALQLAVTERCNLGCAHCFWGRQQHPGLSLATYRRVLEDATSLGALFLKLTGGEPLLRTDLLEIVRAARHLSYAVSIDTNGTLVTPALAAGLAEVGLFEVGVSLHAANALDHERITGRQGSFRAALDGVRALREQGLRVRIKCSVLAQAHGGWRGLPELARGLGCAISLDPLIFPREGAGAPTRAIEGAVSPEEQEEALRVQLSAERSTHAAAPSAPGEPDPSAEGSPQAPGERAPCGAGTWSLDVRPDGEVRPCTQWDLALGSVANEPLAAIWTRARRSLGRLRRDAVEGCSACELFERCGQCPALQARMEGDWRKPTALVCTRARQWERVRQSGQTPGARDDEPHAACDH